MTKPFCLIAARAGSKRLPGKNLLPLAGKPLVAHSVEQAKLAGIKDIAISSDSDEILQAAKQYGANIIIKRPPELASDEASSLDVIRHALETAGGGFDSVVFLQVTSPLRLPDDIKTALAAFYEKPCGSLVSVVATKCFDVELVNNRPTPVADFGKQRYRLNGSIYIWDKQRFLAEPKHFYDNSKLLLMPDLRSIDIDYRADFQLAEAIIANDEYKKGEAVKLN